MTEASLGESSNIGLPEPRAGDGIALHADNNGERVGADAISLRSMHDI